MPPDQRDSWEASEAQRAAAERLKLLAYWLDDRFAIPGTRWRIGLDGLAGLVPGVGDLITTAVSAYIVSEAHRLGVPRTVLLRMAWNVAVDTVVGAIPAVGDVFDVGWKANRKNLALLLRHLERHAGQAVVSGHPVGKPPRRKRA